MLLTLLITLSLVIDLSNSFWIARARGGRGGRFTRWGRSDPAMVEGTIPINLFLSNNTFVSLDVIIFTFCLASKER